MAAATPQPPAKGNEFGVTMSLPFSSWMPEGDGESSEVYNLALASLSELEDMRKSLGQVRALSQLYTLPIMSTVEESRWVADDDGEDEAEFANLMFDLPPQSGGMTVSKERFIREAAGGGVFYGFAAFEQVRHIPNKGPLQGKLALRKLAHRNQHTVKFRVDREGGYDGFRQEASRPNGETVDIHIPAGKSWYWAHNEEENPLYGVSAFDTALSHWSNAKKLYYLMHVAGQLTAVPARLGKYPRDADKDKIDALKEMARSFGFNASGVLPDEYDLSTPLSSDGGFDFLPAIDHHLTQISKSLLAPFVDERRHVLIDNASDPNADLFVQSLQSIMSGISQRLTHYLMPFYIDYNFGTGKYPTFKFGPLSSDTIDTLKNLLSTIASSPQPQWTSDFIRELEVRMAERLGLDIDYEEIAEREEAEKAANEEVLSEQREFLRSRSGGGGGLGGFGAPQGGGAPPGAAPGAPPGGGAPPPGPPGAGEG